VNIEEDQFAEIAESQKDVAEAIEKLAEALVEKKDEKKEKPKVREITVTGPTGKYVGKVTVS
jgi:hypothetical protein